MSTFDFDIILAPALIIAANLIIYFIMGRFSKRSTGTGAKFEPFTGGETDVPKRGVYHSGLFVFAMLFLVVESFVLLLAGSYTATSNFYPLLFLVGGSGVIVLTIWWFLVSGGGKI